MEQRLKIQEAIPTAWETLYGLEKYLHTLSLNPIYKHLIRIRASQINNCGFCINMHTKEALKDGETQQRIFLISAWKESNLFSEEEKAVLAITEEITNISGHGLSDASYQKGEELFGKDTLAQIIMTAIAINSWNRIAISTKL